MKKLAIIGGGIGGLALALFAKQRQMTIPVYEKNSALVCADNLLWMAPNGLHLLDALGLKEAVQAHSVAQDAMLFSNKNLQPLMGLDSQQLIKTNGYPIRAIKRGVLYQLILDQFLASGGEIHFQHSLSGIKTSKNKVRLMFEQAPSVSMDGVIGADGIGSPTRRWMAPHSKVAYQGIRAYLGRSETPLAQRYIGQTIEVWGDNGTRFMLTGFDARTVYWSAMARQSSYQANSAALAPDLLAQLQEKFSGYHADIGEILQHAQMSGIQRNNFGCVEGLTHYYQDKVCLIGDAAHGMPPNMGQGASLALEDAYTLVACLQQHETLAAAFAQYHQQRLPRVRSMMQMANSMNYSFQPKGKLASKLRNVVAAVMPQTLSQIRMAALYQVPFQITN